MNFFQSFERTVGPADFSKWCLRAAVVWFLVLYPLLLWFCPKAIPTLMRPKFQIDVYQYYAGAVVVREGLWDSLYPVPLPGLYTQPNHFQPVYRTFLFNPEKASRSLVFYPPLNTWLGSTWAPRLKAAFPEATSYSYIYPPPTALLCSPLALFSFRTAADRVWPAVCFSFLFVMTFYSSRIYRVLRGGNSYGEGIVILACMFFSARGQTHLPEGNVSPILSGCIAACVYCLLRARLPAFSCGYLVLVLFKGIALSWLPLLVLDRKFRPVFLYLGGITVMLNGIVLAFAGTGVYREFFQLLPLIQIPTGDGLVPALIRNFGFYPASFYFVANYGGLALLYYGYWKNRGAVGARSMMNLVAFLAGTLAIFCLFNNVIWPPYASSYLFFPFLGWMTCEGHAASGTWRKAIIAGTVVGFVVLSGGDFLQVFLGAKRIQYFFDYVRAPANYVIVPGFFLAVALRRLLMLEREAVAEATLEPAATAQPA